MNLFFVIMINGLFSVNRRRISHRYASTVVYLSTMYILPLLFIH